MGIDEKVGISYVYNKEDEPVGRLVLDYELIIDMYARAYLREIPQDGEGPGHVLKEQTIAPRGASDTIHKRLNAHLAWWKKASDGSLYLKHEPPDNDN